ncbi:SDR family oxidoreductase [Streptomyces mirabilis]|uniref:SDR family oxidoreductase n=1 Tax=Streptomyces mirabilis TaxID=68239 RepID=UPI003333475B
MAEAAAREGADAVVASRRRAAVDGALRRLPEGAGGAEGRGLDVTDEDEVRGFFAGIGDFDHLVFTAGEALPLEEPANTDIDRARRFLDTPVLTTGTAGRRPMPGTTVAAGLCGAMESLTRALALEPGPIRLNVVSPGAVRTELWRELPEADREGLFASTARSLPVGRVGEPEDVAEAYLYLMGGRFSTGSTVVVDGGAVLM